MLTFHASVRPCRRVSLTSRIVVLLSLLAGLMATPALASSNPYGRLARFGGFDTSAYNSGHYGGSLTAGKFLDPTGFAVDTNDASAPDNTALYVVDRTSGDQGATTSWRLQKLNDAGAVLGSTTFTLPNEGDSRSALAGLAVDDSGGAGGRVYALVVGNDGSITGLAYAKELLAWSTVPSGSALVAAKEGSSALPADPLGSTGGLISGAAQLAAGLSEEQALYDPQGIALDVTGGHHDIVVQASDNLGSAFSGVSDIPGVAGVWQVATAPQGGKLTGDLLGSWSASSLVSPVSERQAAPYGISTNPDGSLNVLIANTSNGAPIAADVLQVSADLGTTNVLLDSPDVAQDLDRSPSYLAVPPGPFAGSYVDQAEWAGPGIVQLSGGLYASDFEIAAGTDNESPNGDSYYWTQASTVTGTGNVGIRILQPKPSGLLSDPQASTILNTLGGGECALPAESQSLAAGANGTLWALGRGLDTANWVDGATSGSGDTVGRQIVELGPGAGSLCPQPSGPFSASKTQFAAGTTVHFNAETVNLQHGVPFAYEWDLNGDTSDGPKHDGFELVNTLGLWPNGEGIEVISWPPPTAEYKYTEPGEYTVRLRVISDYGTYEAPSQTLTVTAAPKPVAQFNVTTASPSVGQPTDFDASASTAPVGSTLVNYHWEWGDGSEEDGQSGSSYSHAYATAGTYAVTLKVEDSEHRVSEVLAKEVVVAGVTTSTTTTMTTSSGTTTSATSTTSTNTPPPPDHAPTNVSPQANAGGAPGVVTTTVSCPASKVSCAGTVQVKTATAVAAKAKKKKAKKSQLVLGSTSFSLAGGSTQKLTIHLSGKGMALLVKAKSLRVIVIVSAHDSFGDPGTQTFSLTLHAPAKKSGRRAKHH
jgi:PKD repeat protein